MISGDVSTPTLDSIRRDTSDGPIYKKIVLAYFIASLALAMVAMLAGFLYSLQFLGLYPFAEIEWFSPARWRIVHTHIVLYGFLANAGLGTLHWIVPQLTRRPVLGLRWSWSLFVAWQCILAVNVTAVILGDAKAVPWGETPVWIDPVVTLLLMTISVGFLVPIVKCRSPRPIAMWYIVIALVSLPIIYAIGNLLPERFVRGAAAGTSGPSMADMTAMLIMPLGWGFIYYFVSVILEKPIWSHRLALVGWVGVILFFPLIVVSYGLAGQHLISPRLADAISTIAVVALACTVMVNFFASVRQGHCQTRTHPVMRWFCMGGVFYVAVCVQRLVRLAPSFYDSAGSSDWTIAHSHLIVFGVFGFWLVGVMTHLLPKLLGATGWYQPRWHAWHFWLTGLGLLVMFVDLTTSGVIQQRLWHQLAPWEESITASAPYWIIRTVAGVAIIVGHMVFICHVAMTAIHKRTVTLPKAEIMTTGDQL